MSSVSFVDRNKCGEDKESTSNHFIDSTVRLTNHGKVKLFNYLNQQSGAVQMRTSRLVVAALAAILCFAALSTAEEDTHEVDERNCFPCGNSCCPSTVYNICLNGVCTNCARPCGGKVCCGGTQTCNLNTGTCTRNFG